ncbi:serine hydrolase [Streptomyces sp. bgisy060]|uniref:serine hydrolase n=1 Tax=Streptomyces sp. bgisy060 TaxID=3413775 RepID=UPI003EBF6257
MKRRRTLLVLPLLGVVLAAASCVLAPDRSAAAPRPAPPGPTAPPVTAPVRPAPLAPAATAPPPSAGLPPSASAPSPERAARAALDALGPHPGRYALAVEDLTSGRSVTYGAVTESFVSASIIKVDILAALLLHVQDRGTPLTAEERRLASAMICRSDNDAAQQLWIEVGRRPGLDAANGRLGFSGAHAGQQGPWGLTRTTVLDQLNLLRRVFTEDSPLTAESRAYLRSLMGGVLAGQDWGVSAASSPAGAFALKNGWLRRDATHRWVVHSIGRVEHGGHVLLVAVLTDGQLAYEDGISLVERTAATAVRALTGDS